MDFIAYQNACKKIVNKAREKNGVGTLREKTIHAVIKNYIEPDEKYQEVRIKGFYADVFKEQEIFEIQTRNFQALRKKLDIFLEMVPVTIVYPIPYIKYVYWIDEEANKTTKGRKSPKRGKKYDVFQELYKIKSYLIHPNMRIKLLLINMEEYRLLNGWSQDRKKGSKRFDRLPLELVDEIDLKNKSDYQTLIPDKLREMKDGFISKDYKKETGLTMSQAQTALNILFYIGAVKRIGKKGNCYHYKVLEDN